MTSSTSPTKALSVRENSPALLERCLWSQIAKLLEPSHQAGDCGPFGDDRILVETFQSPRREVKPDRRSGLAVGLGGVFRAPGDNGLQGQIVLVCGLAEVRVEAVVADVQRVVVSAGLLVLLLPDAAALDQLAARGAAEDAVRGGHRVRACDRFDRDVEVEGQGRDGADALGGFDVGAGEFDAVRGHCSSPCLRCNDGHLAAGQGSATPKAKRSGEGQAPVFLIREEWPAGAGEKDRRQTLWKGRQI